MATLRYPVKMLHDESNQPFIPFTAIDVIYNKYTSVSQLPTPAREGNVATVQDGNDYNLYIYYNGAWSPLTQEGPAGESGVYVGPTAPTDGSTVWIDNSGTTAVLKLYDGSAWESVPAITGADGRDGAIQYTTGNGININSSNVISADVDSAPTASSNKLLSSGAIYTALGNKQDTIVFNTAYNPSSNKAATMSDLPTVPTVGNGTLTIQKNSATIDSFTANATANKTINITVPTNTNELTNGANFITAAGVPGALAFMTAYNASSNKIATASDLSGKQNTIVFNTAYDATTNKAATMADIQTPPTVGNGTLTIQKNGTAVDTFTANATADKTINITVPTNTNQLTNGAGFITSSGVPTSITWNTAYNASSNKAATMSDVPVNYSGTSTPASSLGKNGDLYILTD